MSVNTVREDQAIRQATDRLTGLFADIRSAEQIETDVATARHRFNGSPIRDFVPILVERIVRENLETEARTAADAGPEAATGTDPEVPMGQQPESANTGVKAHPGATAETRSENGADTQSSEKPHLSVTSRSTGVHRASANRKRIISVLVAAVVVGAVAVVAVSVSGGSSHPLTPKPLTTVRGAIGSEKAAFFEDPQVRKALADNGIRVEVDAAGSRQIATSLDLQKYDFAFPSSAPAGDRIQRLRHVGTKYTPFSSPMAIATFQPIAQLLAKAGVAKHHGATWSFDVGRYLQLAGKGVRWDQLAKNTTFPVHKKVLVSTTDPRSSNSAAMYLAVTSYVANGNTIVQGAAAEKRVLPAVSRLFVGQGYTDNTTTGPFSTYLSAGMGETPLVWIYEAQFVDAVVHGQIKPGMVLMYPSPTVLSTHTLVPLDAKGDKVGRLLSTDPELQRLAAEHGFRTADPARFAKVAVDHRAPVALNLIDVVDTPTYDSLERLLDGVGKSYG
ncbi:three-helix bundle dimerization domain-containing protein [Actinoallomurus sp. CA-150999]|uniref:three-helix bundle dimerization domain-containing protein n=1 Tax=Actinoallomurus sp. CA-150999 TaxID=3239887 RepID=UPI003D91E92D